MMFSPCTHYALRITHSSIIAVLVISVWPVESILDPLTFRPVFDTGFGPDRSSPVFHKSARMHTWRDPLQLSDQNNDALQVTFANGDPIYTSSAMMRKSYYSSNATSFGTALANGVMTLTMNANVTVDVAGGRYVYDAELTSSNGVSRIIEGHVTVRPEATKI